MHVQMRVARYKFLRNKTIIAFRNIQENIQDVFEILKSVMTITLRLLCYYL